MSETTGAITGLTASELASERFNIDNGVVLAERAFAEEPIEVRAKRKAAEDAVEAALNRDHAEHAERARAHYAARQAAKQANELEANRLFKAMTGLHDDRYMIFIETHKDGGRLLSVWDDVEQMGMAWRITSI